MNAQQAFLLEEYRCLRAQIVEQLKMLFHVFLLLAGTGSIVSTWIVASSKDRFAEVVFHDVVPNSFEVALAGTLPFLLLAVGCMAASMGISVMMISHYISNELVPRLVEDPDFKGWERSGQSQKIVSTTLAYGVVSWVFPMGLFTFFAGRVLWKGLMEGTPNVVTISGALIGIDVLLCVVVVGLSATLVRALFINFRYPPINLEGPGVST